MRTLIFDLLCQEKITPKNAPVPDAGYTEVYGSWWFILFAVILAFLTLAGITAVTIGIAFIVRKLRSS